MDRKDDKTQAYWFRELFSTLPGIAKSAGCSLPYIALSYAVGYIFHSADSEKFRTLHLYEYSYKKRAAFVGNRDTRYFCSRLNAGATAEELAVFDTKHLFNAAFRDLIRRDWLYVPDSSPEQLRAFLGRTGKFLAKDDSGTQGRNIFLHDARQLDPEAFLRQYQGRPFLLETFIDQHPAMAALNPTTVNTLRIQTIRRGDQVRLVGGCIRVGGADAYVDNFHQGGVAYPLDVQAGAVSGPGRRLTGELFRRHPSTGIYMPGFQAPFWDRIVDTVKKAAVTVPHVGYVGWDVAVAPDGPELIEGNIRPDPIVFQLDGQGKRRMIRDFVEGT